MRTSKQRSNPANPLIRRLGVQAILAAFALALAFTLSCSDWNSGSTAKASSGKTNDGHDVVVYNRGDLDESLFKIDTVYITDTSFLGRLFFKNLADSKTPEPNDIIASSITKSAPYGFLYRVLDVSRESGGVTIVSVGYASIAEAVEEADIEFEVPLIYDDEEDGEQSVILEKSLWGKVKSVAKKAVNTVVEVVKPIIDVLAGNWNVGGTNGKTIEIKDKKASFGGKNGGGDVKLNGKYILSLTAKIKLKNYSLNYAKMSVAQNKELKLEGNLWGNIDYNKDFPIGDGFSLPTVEFSIGPVPVVLKNEAIVKAKVEAKAQANMNAHFTFKEFSEYGFEYDGSFKKISVCEKDLDYDYKYSAHGGVRLGVMVEFSSMCYGIAGFGISAGPSLLLEGPGLPLSANSQTKLKSDLDVYVDAKLQVLDYFSKRINFATLRTPLHSFPSSKAFPSFSFKRSDFNVANIASGKLSFPFKIDKPSLGFTVVEAGFCMETSAGECSKGPGYGTGRFGKSAGSTVSFEGLTAGTYSVIPYFKSMDGSLHYDLSNAISGFVVDSYCRGFKYDPRTQFCSTSGIMNKSFVSDDQGNSYMYVQIGSQTWMAENFAYSTRGSANYSYMHNNDNYEKYGVLYDYAAAMDLPASCNFASCASLINEPHRGICPDGWHIPSIADWSVLLHYASGSGGTAVPYESPKAGLHLKTTSGWSNYNNNNGGMSDGNGVDTYGFSALPGGMGTASGGSFSFSLLGYNGGWWSSTEYEGDGAYRLDMYGGDKAGWTDAGGANRKHAKTNLFSIRCVKD